MSGRGRLAGAGCRVRQNGECSASDKGSRQDDQCGQSGTDADGRTVSGAGNQRGGSYNGRGQSGIGEGGYKGLSKLYGNGILVAGDAAGFALNTGVTVRGMEFAIASGVMAAETIIDAKEKGDFSMRTLSSYEGRLKKSFVLQDMESCKEMPGFLENDDFFAFYTERFPGFLERALWFGEGPKGKMGKTLWKEIKSSGMLSFKRLKELYRIKNI